MISAGSKKNGQPPKEIAESVKKDVSEVKKVLEECKEGGDYLYPAQTNFICQMKSFCDPPNEIAEAFEEDYGKPISVNKVKSTPCHDEEKNYQCPRLYH